MVTAKYKRGKYRRDQLSLKPTILNFFPTIRKHEQNNLLKTDSNFTVFWHSYVFVTIPMLYPDSVYQN